MTSPPKSTNRSFSQTKQTLLGWISHDYFPILLLLGINLIIGWWIFPTYGESWDEQLRFQYGERSLAAYSGNGRSLVDEKGAFYVMAARLGSDVLRWLNPALKPIQAWHFIHFLAFLLGIFFLYKICLKFVGKWPALGAVLLFNTSPLLWGHAFINPKDIPFMSFFLGSIALGLDMVDRFLHQKLAIGEAATPGAWSGLQTAFQKDRRDGKNRRRSIYLLLAILTGILLIGIGTSAGALRDFTAEQIEHAATPQAQGLLSKLFDLVAENRAALPVEQYIHKGNILLARFTRLSLLIGTLFIGFCLARGYPGTARAIWGMSIKPFFRQLWHSLGEPKVWLAGIFLGLATAIRVLGPAAALLVGLYFIIKARWKALPMLAAYAGIAFLAVYITWPYLWNAPIGNFLHSLSVASDYPWEGKVRFGGVDFPVTSVPRSFLPVLMIIQTPEIALLLFFGGLVISFLAVKKKKLDGALALVAALWFWLPVLSAIVMQPTMYDNFRQFLFILPASYVFIAVGLWFLLGFIQKVGWKLVVILLLALPSLIALVRLHPYQYIYYNNLVGGVSGAFREYETDYWATSYRSAAEYLSQEAPPGAQILVLGPAQLVSHYARPDLEIQEYAPQKSQLPDKPFYVILTTRYDKDLSLFPDAQEVFRVERDGAVLVVVKRVVPD